jgi:ribulose-phosphate 3-epimerase
MHTIKIAPSVLACDMSNLSGEAVAMERAGAHMLHLDIMDGVFVHNITFGPPVIKCLRPHTKLLFDAHLMIADPARYLTDLAKAGCDHITFHVEADIDIASTITGIKALGMTAGLSVKPSTPASAVFPYLELLSMVLVMTVEPGFGGQEFMRETVGKITEVREEADRRGLSGLDVQVDGGITADTAPIVVKAGANVLVAGSSLFGAKDYAKAVKALEAAAYM